MRSLPFKEVLWAVAYKFGLDPEQSNFLTNQALPLGNYIREWVRRLYSGADYPEWTHTHQFVPDSNHIVPWDAIATDLHPSLPPGTTQGTLVQIGRPLTVYLVDPRTTDAPIDTPFTEREEGIHVGYEHGSVVWIKYLDPAPKFTAEVWDSATTFQKDDVRYSASTGECYKSKVNNNQGHDPAATFVPAPPPTTEITQERTPDNPGSVERNEIYLIDFDHFKPNSFIANFHIPDPPALNDEFYIDIVDADGVFIGESGAPHLANGVETVSDIMAILAASLQADLGGSWVCTGGSKSVTVEHNSVFRTAHAYYKPALGYPYFFPVPMVTQSYIPAVSGTSGQPQITKLTLTQDQVITGATYQMTFRGPDGNGHVVEYVAQEGDSAAQVLTGLTAAIEAARVADEYFNSISPVTDPTLLTLNVGSRDVASVETLIAPPGSPWWETVRMPEAIADQVIRGATADLWKEWWQTDKGLAEEQIVPLEKQITTERIQATPYPPLTTQERPLSRYKIDQ